MSKLICITIALGENTSSSSFGTWIHCRSSFEVKVALKLINFQDLRDTSKVNNGGLHKLPVAVVVTSSISKLCRRSKEH